MSAGRGRNGPRIPAVLAAAALAATPLAALAVATAGGAALLPERG